MTRIIPLFFNDQIYFAEELKSLLGGLVPHGGSWGHQPSVADQTSFPRQIQISAGISYVREGVIPATACPSDAVESVQLNPAPPSGQTRIDRVICRPRSATRDWIFEALPGTATSGTPVAPAVPAGTLSICRQRVIGGQPTISAGPWNDANLIDDRRPPLPLEHVRSYWLQGGSNIDLSLFGGQSQLIHPSFVAPYTKVYGQGTKLIVTMSVSGAMVNSSVIQGIWHSLEFTHGSGIGGAPVRTVVPAGTSHADGSGTFELLNIPFGTYNIVPSIRSDQNATVRYYGNSHQISIQIMEVPA